MSRIRGRHCTPAQLKRRVECVNKWLETVKLHPEKYPFASVAGLEDELVAMTAELMVSEE